MESSEGGIIPRGTHLLIATSLETQAHELQAIASDLDPCRKIAMHAVPAFFALSIDCAFVVRIAVAALVLVLEKNF